MGNLEKKGSDILSHSKSLNLNKSQSLSLFSILTEKDYDKLDENVANKLIKSGNIEILVKNLSKFRGLSNEIAKKLIKSGYIDNLAKNLSSFQGLDKNTAKFLIKDWYGCFKCCLSSFTQLDNKIANILINNGDYDELVRHLRSFEYLDSRILVTLLVKCTKYKQNLLYSRAVFGDRGEENKGLLHSLKQQGKINEYRKLKEFYGTIKFEKIKENFESDYRFDIGFNMNDAKEAVKYKKGKYVIEFLDQFKGNSESFYELINLLIEGGYINDLKNNISKLWGHNLDRYELILQLSLTNNYNTLINNSDNFEDEGISNLEIAYEIIKNSDLDCRDSVKKLNNYSDEEDWNRINYNLDLYSALKHGSKDDFDNIIKYFKSDFSPLPSNRKLPLKLKNLVKEKFGLNAFAWYKDIFED